MTSQRGGHSERERELRGHAITDRGPLWNTLFFKSYLRSINPGTFDSSYLFHLFSPSVHTETAFFENNTFHHLKNARFRCVCVCVCVCVRVNDVCVHVKWVCVHVWGEPGHLSLTMCV